MTKILTQYEKGWLEAAVDGEGSISISFQKQKTSPRPNIRVIMSISNTNRDFLVKAQHLFGAGSICHKTPDGNRKGAFVLSVHARMIREILPQLDLIIKKRQKELALETLSLLEGYGKGSRKGFHGGKMRSLWKDEKITELKKELNSLNKRGRVLPDTDALIQTRRD